MAIFRGIGGAGDSTTDATVTAVTEQATNAANSATAAASSASSAATSATNAATSATNAATSATNAAASETAAAASETAAAASETAAAASETAAETAYDNFDDRYLGQKSSAPALDNDGDALLTGALYFNTADNNMYVYTGSAWASVSNTVSSAAAATSASAAATSETNAASSASSASTSASNAATSASSASTSASNASTSETNAASSATAAASSATSAASSASSASTSASNAATSETNAATSETNAATSETNAASSATAAASSATSASTSASNASTSETNAASSASSASTSATNAATSATSAASAQTAAESARDSALAAYDNFDDRYLGAKSSDPSLDNDGNALVAGALYFNTTSEIMKVYTGSTWVDAYAAGTTFLAKASNLSDLANAATARTNLGVSIGTDVQAYSSVLAATTASFTTAKDSKLSGIETGATADQTAGEIKTAYESNANTNAFTDAEKTKLSGIETSADVTDATNVAAAGAAMDSDFASQGLMKRGATSGSYSIVTDNSTNWNTAYGWGDHSSAGYLTSTTGVQKTSSTGSGALPSGTTAQRDGSPSAGYIRFNTTDTSFEGYDGTAWGAIGGGGGASALNDLTDVAITSVADGDLLRYNGTASEWQNTNLGISVAPTISLQAGTIYTGIPATFTVTNHASYDDPAYFFQLKSGATVVVDNDSFTRDLYGSTITFTPPASSGTYTLESRTQDFGDLASEVTSTSVTVTALPALRYYRLTFVGGSSSNYLRDFRVYTAAGQTGTEYPVDMTSDTAPSPYVASSSGAFSTTYAAWKAFDNQPVNTGWWNLAQTPYTTAWVQIDLGSSVVIQSAYVRINTSYQNYSSFKISGSSTGAFSGEEADIFSTTDSSSEIFNFG